MKNLFTFLLALSIFSLVGCVDREFDLSDVNDENVGLGDANSVVTVPITTIELNFEDILSNYTRATQSYTLSNPTIEKSIELGENWLDEDLKSTLTDGDGDIYLTLECVTYPAGFPSASYELWFDDIAILDQAQTISEENPSITTSALNDQMIDEIAASTSLNYKVTFSELTFECDLEELENLTFQLSLTRTGAIKF